MRGFTREALRQIIPGLTEAQEAALIGLYLDAVGRLKRQIEELKKGTKND